jgi:hypothetical protein
VAQRIAIARAFNRYRAEDHRARLLGMGRRPHHKSAQKAGGSASKRAGATMDETERRHQ